MLPGWLLEAEACGDEVVSVDGEDDLGAYADFLSAFNPANERGVVALKGAAGGGPWVRCISCAVILVGVV